MTEDQIERKVERFVDHLDRAFTAGQIDQAAYDSAMRDIDDWARAQSQIAAVARLRNLLMYCI